VGGDAIIAVLDVDSEVQRLNCGDIKRGWGFWSLSLSGDV
jgi:hypothetical protein